MVEVEKRSLGWSVGALRHGDTPVREQMQSNNVQRHMESMEVGCPSPNDPNLAQLGGEQH